MLTAAASLSITRQEELSFPLVPSYEQSQAEASGSSTPNASSRSGSGKEGDDWIIGVHETVKAIMVMHNPNPTGGFSDLDMRQSGFAPGIGVWDLKIFSDVVSLVILPSSKFITFERLVSPKFQLLSPHFSIDSYFNHF